MDEEAFLACPEESVDYAVMERTADAVVVPMDAGWSDVGSWSSLWEISAHTAEGNVCHGDVINHKTENSYVYAESGTVTTVGGERFGGSTDQRCGADCRPQCGAGCEKKWSSRSKPMVAMSIGYIAKCIARGANMTLSTRATATRVKRITVKPGEGLSVQMHHHRAEHWVVVAGTAKVTIDGDIKLLGENESIYIPLGGDALHWKTRGKFRSI